MILNYMNWKKRRIVVSKKGKRKIIDQNIMSLGKTVSDSEQYLQTINIREKRIGLVFKVIYVVAILLQLYY